MKTAIVVPGVTDLNKGDQALVWESHRLAQDTGLFSKVYIVSNGDTQEEYQNLCAQSLDRGYEFVENILKHPRRGKHHDNEHIKESGFSYLSQIFNAGRDFLSTWLLIGIAPYTGLVKLLFSRRTFETVKRFKECDTVFVKGGGFIHAYGEKTAPYLMWYFLFYVRLAKRLGKKTVFLPNSYGPFRGLSVKSQVVSVFKDLDLIFARETISRNELMKAIDREVILSPDLGFYLEQDAREKGAEILRARGLDPDAEKIVGITIRPWRFPGKVSPEELYEKYIGSVGKLVSYLKENGYKVAFFNQSLGPNSHEDDRNAIRALSQYIDNKDVFWIDDNYNCTTLKAIYSNLYFFVGTRFHSVIFSMMAEVPSMAIAYGGNKALGIMAEFDLNQYVVPIEDVTGEALVEMFSSAQHEYGSIKKILKYKITEILDKRQKTINLIRSVVSNPN